MRHHHRQHIVSPTSSYHALATCKRCTVIFLFAHAHTPVHSLPSLFPSRHHGFVCHVPNISSRFSLSSFTPISFLDRSPLQMCFANRPVVPAMSCSPGR